MHQADRPHGTEQKQVLIDIVRLGQWLKTIRRKEQSLMSYRQDLWITDQNQLIVSFRRRVNFARIVAFARQVFSASTLAVVTPACPTEFSAGVR